MDISKAFDKVWHLGLYILVTGIEGNLFKSFETYLKLGLDVALVSNQI